MGTDILFTAKQCNTRKSVKEESLLFTYNYSVNFPPQKYNHTYMHRSWVGWLQQLVVSPFLFLWLLLLLSPLQPSLQLWCHMEDAVWYQSFHQPNDQSLLSEQAQTLLNAHIEDNRKAETNFNWIRSIHFTWVQVIWSLKTRVQNSCHWASLLKRYSCFIQIKLEAETIDRSCMNIEQNMYQII